jgi:hypothetical protein
LVGGPGFSTGPIVASPVLRALKNSRLLLKDFNDTTDYRRHRIILQVTSGVLNNSFIGSKNSGWPYIAVHAE